MDTVATTLRLNSRMDPRIVCACDFESPPIMLEPIGDLKWLQNAEQRIAEIIAKPNPTIEEKKDLQVDCYYRDSETNAEHILWERIFRRFHICIFIHNSSS